MENAPKASESQATGPVFFYGAGKENGFLSQMYVASVEIDGIVYNCSEQYFQARKAMEFADEKTREKIMREAKPKKQKALGKKVHPFDGERWGRVAYQVVVDATYAKFATHADLRERLFCTGDREIAEASPFDKIWGIGMGIARAQDHKRKSGWNGKNLLGKAIEEVRRRLRDEYADQAQDIGVEEADDGIRIDEGEGDVMAMEDHC